MASGADRSRAGSPPWTRPVKAVALAAALALPGGDAAALYHVDTYASETWDRTIPVCFDSTTVRLPDFDALRAQLMDAVARTWTQATGLRFTGWGECPRPGTVETINVGVNTINVGCDSAQTCPGGRPGCPDRIDINVCPPAWFDAMLIHEFGHALGFAHEMARPGFPDYGTCSEADEPGGDDLHTIPDRNSVMNATYDGCHVNPELSAFDIAGAQNLWGRPNFFADVTGDGRADAIVVNPDGVWVRVTDSSGRMPAASQRNWTGDGFWGWRGTHFADVDGDGRADLIAVDEAGVAVRLAIGRRARRDPWRFAPASDWTAGGYWGERGTYFADVTGDGRADAIVVNDDGGVFVGVSDGSRFVRDGYWLTGVPNDREAKNHFADVTGADADGRRRADLIAVNTDGIVVCPASIDGGFAPCVNWTGNSAFAGRRGVLFADYDGDGRDDAIGIDGSDGGGMDVRVGFSSGSSFSAARLQISNGPQSERGVHFANVNSSPQAELIIVNEDGVWVRGTIPRPVFYNATRGASYGLR